MKKITILLLAILVLPLLASCGTLLTEISNENEYAVDLTYCDSDKIFNINKNSGIFVICITGDSTWDRLFEISIKKELQTKGYSNIILASYCTDIDLDSQSYGEYALLNGCEFMIAYAVEKSWIYETGGGLSGSSSGLMICDIKSALYNKNHFVESVSYYFIVSAENHFQSYNSSLVTFNSFMAKQIINEISVHLSDEASEDSQAFFDYGQKGAIEDYFEEYEK